MKSIVERDATVEEMSNLSPGYTATRKYLGDKWLVRRDERM